MSIDSGNCTLLVNLKNRIHLGKLADFLLNNIQIVKGKRTQGLVKLADLV